MVTSYRTPIVFIAAVLCVLGYTSPFSAHAAILEPGFETETVATGLVLPTALTFAEDGRIFVAEKGGSVRVIENGVLQSTPVITLTDINTFGDRGLLGIATDPNFASNGYLYLSYTYENTPGANIGGEKTGRIVRVTVVGNTASEASKVVLVGTVGGTVLTPSCEQYAVTDDCIPSDSPSHSMGGLRFGPDGKLYAALGDGAHFDYADVRSLRAQNLDSLAGKYLRINTDGTAPSDNPFYNGNPNANRSKVFALGVRNAFRFNFNPTTGALFAGDVGWSRFEEVDRIVAGANYGWPCYEGFEKTTHNCEASSATTSPVYAYAHDSTGAGSVTAGAFATNNAYPDQYDTSLFVADYAQNWIRRLVIDPATNALVSVHDFDDSPNGPVDVSTGPDGTIYYLAIYTGELNRITHTSGNRRPVPVIAATPTSGLTPLTVAFSSAGSYDPDTDALTYAWNFGDGATSNLANPTHTYTVNGSFNAVLTLTDSNGAVSIKSLTITAGNQAPSSTITSPASGALYLPGQTIDLAATATDLEDGTLPASAYRWTVILHHNIHIHVMQEFVGVNAPSFLAPDHSATDVYTEVVLTVTDSAGLTHTSSINLYLNNGSTGGNLIANPSLEDMNEVSGQPLSWHQGWYGVMNPVFTYPVAGFDGTARAAQVTVTGYVEGDAKWYFDPITVTPGETYTFSNHYTATAETNLSAQYGFANGTYQYQPLGILPAVATPTHVERSITIPAGAQTLTVFHQIAGNGTLTVDEFSLVNAATPVATTTNLVLNADLETVDGTEPLYWSPGGWGNHTRVYTYPVTGYNGGKAVRAEITTYPVGGTGDTKWAFDKVAVTPGTEYTFSDHYRSNTISDIIGQYTLADGSFHYFGLAKEIQPTTTWATISRTFTPPSTATHVTFFHLISAVGYIEIDDVDLHVSGTGTPSETNAPIVEFTNPLAGQTVSGTVDLTASSTDDTAVTYIFYAVDGIPITGQIATAPYLFAWNSASVADGVHTIKATTHDPFGNNSTHTISVTVNNTTPPPATSTNLILNPSLETVGTNGDPAQWSRGGWGTNNRTYTYPVAGFDGVSAARVDITSYTDGDAKWYFADVPVTPGATYQFSERYQSTVSTQVVARFTRADATVQYQYLGAVPAAAGWVTNAYSIVPPANTVSLTVFHVLPGVGSLTIDQYALTTNIATTDTTAPVVTITAPAIGATLSGATTVAVTATDVVGVAGVTLLIDGAVVGTEDISAPYTFTFDTGILAAGPHTLVARARDAANNIGTSSPVTVTTFHATTTVNLIPNASFEMVGTNGDPAQWFRGGWGTNNRTFTYPVAGVDGASAARVEITSYTDGDAKWYFADVPVTPGATYNFIERYNATVGTELLVRYTLGGGATQYQFLGALPAGTGWATSTFTIVPPAQATSLTIFHILHSVGSLDIDSLVLYQVSAGNDTIAPSVSVADPLAGATINNVTPITVVASDAVGVEGVTLIVDGAPVVIDGLTEDTTAPYVFALDTAMLTNGAHTISATARDAAGNVGTAPSVSVTVLNTLATTTSNLVLNPSLETVDGTGNPLHWFKSGWGNNTRTYTYPVTGSAGLSAARIEVTNYVDGDAKWRHEDVAVTPGALYTFTHAYRSNVTTNLTIRYTRTDGAFQYVSLGNRNASSVWQTVTHTIVVPAGVTSMTIMHIVFGNGWLEVDDYTLTSGTSNTFAQGMISYTFDDGWLSHYTDALPILNAAGTKGTFYITSQPVLFQPTELVQNPSFENDDGAGSPVGWFKGGWGTNDRTFTYPVAGVDGANAARVEITNYTDGDAKWYFADVPVIENERYILSEKFASNVPSEVLVRYTFAGGAVQYVGLGTPGSTGDAWQTYTTEFTTPLGAVSMTVFHLIHGVGYLTIDSYSVKEVRHFVDQSEMLALQAAGHELGGHSRTHPMLTTLTSAEATTEIDGSQTEITGMGGTNVTSFAYPFGDYNDEVKTITQNAGYTSARSVDRGYNTTATDKYALKIQQVGRTTTLADIQAWSVQAAVDKTWLILMFHQIDTDLTASLGITPAFLTDIVNYVNTTSLKVVTVSEGVALMN